MSLKPKEVDFSETWQALQETLKGIITLSYVPRTTWCDRFSDVYSLCVAYPEPLADQLYYETKRFLDNHVSQLLKKVESGSNLLHAYHQAWLEYSQGINYLHCLYLYLNEQHIKKQRASEAEQFFGMSSATVIDCQEQMEIGELGLEIWKTKMIMPLKTQLVKLLLENIDADRKGSSTTASTEVICGVIESFVRVEDYKIKARVDLYQEIFETPFLQASGEFYTSEASELLQQSNVTHYMEKVTWRLGEEEFRARKFLHASSVPKVRQCCEEKMIATHVEWLHSEGEIMIENERLKDLFLLYPLLKSLPSGLTVLVQKFTQYITQQGLKAITGYLQADNKHTEFMETMLKVHHKYSEMVKDVFKSDKAFVAALDKACAVIVNHAPISRQPPRAPELLAKYCDSLLKKSAVTLSEREVEEKLSECITVFKYVDDKDVFQKFYARMLAKRLIHQQSQSMDAEESMIDRLKQACGYEFTSKLHRMFTDISVSSDLNKDFMRSLSKANTKLGISFVVYVLQAGAWPLGLPSDLAPFDIPQELEKSIQMFETFYHSQFNGRKLTWLHHLCQGELKFNYLKKSYLVTVQTYQMALLLLFEHCDSIVCKDAATSLRLSHDQLVKHANSLVDCKILKKSTDTALEEDTVLSLNFEYHNKRTKFRITGALQRDVRQECHDIETTHRSVDDDRKLYLQAAIVRIMKSRKVLRHNQLVQEVLSQSKVTFAPSISMIKKCIESLIDKQYIERTPNGADEYSYIV